MRRQLIQWARLAAAGLLAGAVGYSATGSSEGYWALALAGLVGIVAGTLAGSWVVVLLAPAALWGGIELWHRLEAPHVPRWGPDDTLEGLVVMQLILYGAAVLGSTAGVLLSSLAARAMNSSQNSPGDSKLSR
ncbi:MAG: hypothetical protein RQ985_02200 [Dehalococcoidia bacterium]|nr:hypothetical protein [Dehalococcoidia bacterium]